MPFRREENEYYRGQWKYDVRDELRYIERENIDFHSRQRQRESYIPNMQDREYFLGTINQWKNTRNPVVERAAEILAEKMLKTH